MRMIIEKTSTVLLNNKIKIISIKIIHLRIRKKIPNLLWGIKKKVHLNKLLAAIKNINNQIYRKKLYNNRNIILTSIMGNLI